MEGWEVKDDRTIRCGPWTLKAENGALQRFQGKKISVAIRPEDIRIFNKETAGENIVLTSVRHIEFRGASYRLRLRFETDDSKVKPPVVEVDLPVEKLDRLGVSRNKLLSISLPSDRLLFF